MRGDTTTDCCQAESLRPGIPAQYLQANRGYDSQAILQTAHQAEMRPRVENDSWHLQRWGGIATGQGKNSDSFLAVIQIGCIFLWATRNYTMQT